MEKHVCKAAHRQFEVGDKVFLDHVANRPWEVVNTTINVYGYTVVTVRPRWDVWLTERRIIIIGYPGHPCVSTEATYRAVHEKRVA